MSNDYANYPLGPKPQMPRWRNLPGEPSWEEMKRLDDEARLQLQAWKFAASRLLRCTTCGEQKADWEVGDAFKADYYCETCYRHRYGTDGHVSGVKLTREWAQERLRLRVTLAGFPNVETALADKDARYEIQVQLKLIDERFPEEIGHLCPNCGNGPEVRCNCKAQGLA